MPQAAPTAAPPLKFDPDQPVQITVGNLLDGVKFLSGRIVGSIVTAAGAVIAWTTVQIKETNKKIDDTNTNTNKKLDDTNTKIAEVLAAVAESQAKLEAKVEKVASRGAAVGGILIGVVGWLVGKV